jgi:molybdenum cofactor cytidylyltransferase
VFVAGVLLAGRSSRPSPLLDRSLGTARSCGFDQLLVTVDDTADEVRAQVDLSDATVVQNLYFATGRGGSLATVVEWIDPRADGVVVLTVDRPGTRASSVRGLLGVVAPDSIGVCRYQDGLGHPFWFGRELFDELAMLRGDQAVWTLLHSGRFRVTASRVDGAVPAEVTSGEDYQSLVGG